MLVLFLLLAGCGGEGKSHSGAIVEINGDNNNTCIGTAEADDDTGAIAIPGCTRPGIPAPIPSGIIE